MMNSNDDEKNDDDTKINRMYEITSWEDETLDLNSKLLRGIFAYGFEQPSSIQKKTLYPLTIVWIFQLH